MLFSEMRSKMVNSHAQSRAVDFVGSALSLGIYWRAVVLDRLFRAREGGRGRPPSRKFPGSPRTIFSRTAQSVRGELGNSLEGGRPRPPFPSAQRRTRKSALQKILKLGANRTRIANHCSVPRTIRHGSIWNTLGAMPTLAWACLLAVKGMPTRAWSMAPGYGFLSFGKVYLAGLLAGV